MSHALPSQRGQRELAWSNRHVAIGAGPESIARHSLWHAAPRCLGGARIKAPQRRLEICASCMHGASAAVKPAEREHCLRQGEIQMRALAAAHAPTPACTLRPGPAHQPTGCLPAAASSPWPRPSPSLTCASMRHTRATPRQAPAVDLQGQAPMHTRQARVCAPPRTHTAQALPLQPLQLPACALRLRSELREEPREAAQGWRHKGWRSLGCRCIRSRATGLQVCRVASQPGAAFNLQRASCCDTPQNPSAFRWPIVQVGEGEGCQSQ